MADVRVNRRTALKTLAALPLGAPLLVGRERLAFGTPDSLRFDPWVEVDRSRLFRNVETVSGLVGGRPILAVVKNNAYGLGLKETARLLAGRPEIAGFAVVKASAAADLSAANVGPVLLMGRADDEESEALARAGVRLSAYTDDDPSRLGRVADRIGRPIALHAYLDTGMGRMGMPVHRAESWIEELADDHRFRVEGTFMAFTENAEFDREQLARFRTFAEHARGRGLALGALHAASSNAVYHLPSAHLDQVRPGIALFGGYPSRPDEERAIAVLDCAVRLRCRVVRVERLRAGDSVNYGRNYVATEPTWVATLPAGHTDGVPREAVRGARVLIGGQPFLVIGAVSASHCIVEVGAERVVQVGDTATFLGPDHPAIEPNRMADATGVSVYDLFMHLSPALPRDVVDA